MESRMQTDVLVVRCFRVERDDTEVPDILVPIGSLDEMKMFAKDRLKGVFFNSSIPPSKKPREAELFRRKDGQVLGKFSMTLGNDGKAELIETPVT